MADIELVIKISEDSYKATCNGWILPQDVENIVQGIKNGIPLPKEHGRLIDENQLLEEIRNDIVGNFDNLEYWLSAADTIIEADKAESEDNQ